MPSQTFAEQWSANVLQPATHRRAHHHGCEHLDRGKLNRNARPSGSVTIDGMNARQTTARLLVIALVGAVGLAACGSDDDASESTDTADPARTDAAPSDPSEPAEETEADDDVSSSDDGEPSDDDGTEDDSAEDGNADAPATGQGMATLTLDNGERYEFGVLCTLEPQVAAGSEILFTATSYDDPSLDITQFGDEGTVTSLSSVSVYDATSFDSLWGASSLYEPFGGGLELTLDGSTIRGTGTFFAGDDPGTSPDGVAGEVVANC